MTDFYRDFGGGVVSELLTKVQRLFGRGVSDHALLLKGADDQFAGLNPQAGKLVGVSDGRFVMVDPPAPIGGSTWYSQIVDWFRAQAINLNGPADAGTLTLSYNAVVSSVITAPITAAKLAAGLSSIPALAGHVAVFDNGVTGNFTARIDLERPAHLAVASNTLTASASPVTVTTGTVANGINSIPSIVLGAGALLEDVVLELLDGAAGVELASARMAISDFAANSDGSITPPADPWTTGDSIVPGVGTQGFANFSGDTQNLSSFAAVNAYNGQGGPPPAVARAEVTLHTAWNDNGDRVQPTAFAARVWFKVSGPAALA